MRIKFMIDGESPEIGVFKCGEGRDISDEIGKIFCARGLAEEIKATAAPVKAAKKEDKNNG